jgi:hypothetical protein
MDSVCPVTAPNNHLWAHRKGAPLDFCLWCDRERNHDFAGEFERIELASYVAKGKGT